MSLSKTVVVGSSLEPMAPNLWTLDQFNSTRPEFLPRRAGLRSPPKAGGYPTTFMPLLHQRTRLLGRLVW